MTLREQMTALAQQAKAASRELARLTTQKERLDSDRVTAVADAERDMQRLSALLGLPAELPEDSEAE